MKGGRYSKYYFKKLICSTTINEDGYPSYRHCDNDIFGKKNEIKLYVRIIVSYSPLFFNEISS